MRSSGPSCRCCRTNRPTPPWNSSTHDQHPWRSMYSPHRPSGVARSSTAFRRVAQSSTTSPCIADQADMARSATHLSALHRTGPSNHEEDALMRLVVNPDRCQGVGLCEAAAADIIEVGEDGQSHVLV